MADEKCQGCLSFCMQGHQLAIEGADGNGSNYPKGWQQWKDLIGESDNNGEPSTIQTSNTLSAQSQLDLINYIKAAYSEGKHNPEDGTLDLDKVKIADGLTIDTTPTKSTNETTLPQADDNVSSNNIIYAYHYNNLLQPLRGSYPPVSQDPRGQELKINGKDPTTNNAKENGPVAGWPGNTTALVTSGQTDYSDNSLIKASLYRDLYEAASKLMYHPYQCNTCNVYEGGQWIEIVEELGRTLYENNVLYDQNGSWSATIGGIHETNRTDCSGFVNGCVNIFNATLTTGVVNNRLTGSSDKYLSRENLPEAVRSYFAPYSPSLPTKKGSIVVRHDGQEGNATSHVEVYGQWSGGGNGGTGTLMMRQLSGSSCDAGLEYLGAETSGSLDGGGNFEGATGGQTVSAMFTAYYPADDPMQGGFYAATGELLNPSSNTCAAPKSVPFGSYIVPSGTGTRIDGVNFRVNDRGGAITIENGVYHFDILMSNRTEAYDFGVRYGTATILN